jgi:hypothetical protein
MRTLIVWAFVYSLDGLLADEARRWPRTLAERPASSCRGKRVEAGSELG